MLLIELTVGEVLGILTMLAVVVAIFYHRYHVLAAADFAIDPPAVPRSVVVAIKHAEVFAYAQEPWYRRAAEYAQDVLTFLVPRLTYRLDFSVGRGPQAIGRSALLFQFSRTLGRQRRS